MPIRPSGFLEMHETSYPRYFGSESHTIVCLFGSNNTENVKCPNCPHSDSWWVWCCLGRVHCTYSVCHSAINR